MTLEQLIKNLSSSTNKDQVVFVEMVRKFCQGDKVGLAALHLGVDGEDLIVAVAGGSNTCRRMAKLLDLLLMAEKLDQKKLEEQQSAAQSAVSAAKLN